MDPRKPRIVSDRFYLLATAPGISGFRRYDEREYVVVTGTKARASRSDVVCEWRSGIGALRDRTTFRMQDGRLPEFQPIGDWDAARAFLSANPFASVVPLDSPAVAAIERGRLATVPR